MLVDLFSELLVHMLLSVEVLKSFIFRTPSVQVLDTLVVIIGIHFPTRTITILKLVLRDTWLSLINYHRASKAGAHALK